MARFVLLSEIRDKARAAVGYENNSHATDAELDGVLKDGARQLFDLLLEVHGPEAYRKQQEIFIVANSRVYDLLSEVHEVLQVYLGSSVDYPEYQVAAKPYYKTSPFAEHERVDLLNRDYTDVRCLRYRLMGREANDSESVEDIDQIEVLPTPTKKGGCIVVSYVPAPVQEALGDGEVRLLAPGAGKDWLIAHGAEYLMRKEKDFEAAAARSADKAMHESRIKAHQGRRDAGEPRRMQPETRSPLLPRRGGDYAEDWEP